MNIIQEQMEAADRELAQILETRLELELRYRRHHSSPMPDKAYDGPRSPDGKGPSGHHLFRQRFREMVIKGIKEEADALIRENRHLVAFQGAHGAYSDVASRKLVPGGISIPNLTFSDVFSGVDKGYYDLGVVPVENSLEGAVTEVNDLLTKTQLKVVGEAILPVYHCMLIPSNTDIAEVRVAYSHPQALAQCRGFLEKRQIEARPFFDTAGAAQMIAQKKPRAAAAIASSLSGELYGLRVAEQGIADNATNSTRFLLLSRPGGERKGDKCSIIFATDHSAGALFNVLQLFAKGCINLTRIASMPRRSDPGNYDFFLDFEGSDQDAHVAQILERVRSRATSFRFLGCYPKDK